MWRSCRRRSCARRQGDPELSRPELFVGVTSWNSALFIGRCLASLRATLGECVATIVVADNGSIDDTPEIVRRSGAHLLDARVPQADAMNRLARLSRAPYTLLIHADVVLLGARWFDLCKSEIARGHALVAPEDIGCGPLTRAFGCGMPESSFLFFDTTTLARLRETFWEKRGPMRWPKRGVDFFGPHVTHHLPRKLAERGLTWKPMSVHWSAPERARLYAPQTQARVWSDELAFLPYGLGNFYSLGGEITHYHNWYDRVRADPAAACEFPADFVAAYTDRFIADYDRGALRLPSAQPCGRRPMAL